MEGTAEWDVAHDAKMLAAAERIRQDEAAVKIGPFLTTQTAIVSQPELPVPMPGPSKQAIKYRIAHLVSMNTDFRFRIDRNNDEISELRDRLVDYDPYG